MSLPTCRITGTIINAQGSPRSRVRFTARISSTGDLPSAVTQDTVAVFTDGNGQFELDLLQGVEVILISEELRYYKRTTVPSLSTIDFRSLT
jgi:hypothetical protein